MTAIDDSDPADAIDALEDEYQTYRVLADSSSLTATITGCGVEDATVLLELSVLGVTCSFTLESTVADLCSLARLCEQVGTPFTGELDALTGEPIDVTFDSSLETVSIPAVELSDRPVAFEPSTPVDQLSTTVPAPVVTAVGRYRQYRTTAPVCPCRVASIAVTDRQLSMHIDFGPEPITVELSIPGPEALSGSPFETLVESVGYGSVAEIEGGSVSIVRAASLARPPEQCSNVVAKVSDLLSTWVVFPAESDGALAVGSQPASTESIDPARLANVGPALAPDESVRFLCSGETIRIERDGGVYEKTTLLGSHWLAATDRRLLFVLATDRYTDVAYESVREVRYDSGLFLQKLGISAVQTEYTFWPSGISEAECKHLLEFVFEQTTAQLSRVSERSGSLD